MNTNYFGIFSFVCVITDKKVFDILTLHQRKFCKRQNRSPQLESVHFSLSLWTLGFTLASSTLFPLANETALQFSLRRCYFCLRSSLSLRYIARLASIFWAVGYLDCPIWWSSTRSPSTTMLTLSSCWLVLAVRRELSDVYLREHSSPYCWWNWMISTQLHPYYLLLKTSQTRLKWCR